MAVGSLSPDTTFADRKMGCVEAEHPPRKGASHMAESWAPPVGRLASFTPSCDPLGCWQALGALEAGDRSASSIRVWEKQEYWSS